ncbi:MAG: T9SS type A sorting domain-containing protein [Bacteroidota bacterium]
MRTFYTLCMIVLLSGISFGHDVQPDLIRLQVYPNPSQHGIFTIDLEHSEKLGEVEIVVYNLIGNIVFEQKIASNQPSYRQSLNLSHLSKGLYMLEVRFEGHKQTRRLSFI